MPPPLGAKCVRDGFCYPPVSSLGPGRSQTLTFMPRVRSVCFGTLRNQGANQTRTYCRGPFIISLNSIISIIRLVSRDVLAFPIIS